MEKTSLLKEKEKNKKQMIKIKINQKQYQVKEGQQILTICNKHGIEIAALCSHPNFSDFKKPAEEDRPNNAVCRLCLVRARERGTQEYQLIPACVLKATVGLEVITEDAEIIRLRKTNLELLFANHAGLCAHCSRNMDCELQNLAIKYDIDEFRFVPRLNEIESNEELDFLYEKMSRRIIDNENPSISRDSEKCIHCGRCVDVCKNMQGIEALSSIGKGNNATVGTEYNTPLECIYCGQCTTVCPAGALTEKNEIGLFIKAVNDPSKTVIVQTAPAVRVSLGEEFGMPPGAIVTAKMVSAIRECGADLVFDTNFGADLTVMEESLELVERIKEGRGVLPLFSSCCPAWVLFLEQNYPEFLDHLSTSRSPYMIVASLIKSYYAKQNMLNPKDIFSVAIMPCTAKKYEASRAEFRKNGIKDVDCVLTTRELGQMLRSKSLKLSEMNDSEFDPALGISTSAGAIFGASGGVTEATMRTAHYLMTGKNAKEIKFKKARGSSGIRLADFKIGNFKLRTKIVYGLKNARKVLEELKKGKHDFDFLEVMACPDGCIGGGGQPMPTSPKIRKARKRAIYAQDKNVSLRMSHENPLVKKIYDEFLIAPGSYKAKKYLHTKYHRYHYKWRK